VSEYVVAMEGKENVGSNSTVVASLPPRNEDQGKTRQKLVEATGVKESKLETILDIGELTETGKILTAKERAEKEKVTEIKAVFDMSYF